MTRTAMRLVPLCFIAGGCTDAGLYQWKHDPYQANKLTISGTVCTDDPHQRRFPVKVLFIIDTSNALLSDKNDNTGWRGKAIDEVVSLWGKNPNYSFGVVAYGAKGRNLVDTGFTKDAPLLAAASASVKGTGGIVAPGGCFGGRCRDLRAAMSLASSIITGDILKSDPGEVARTTYVLALFAGGPPVPPIGRCNCRDLDTETKPEFWAACPWTECDGCKVTCPPGCACKEQTCTPVCTPKCGSGEFCDSDLICKQMPDEGDPKPTCPVLSNQPTTVPDSFTQWIPPATQPFPTGVAACTTAPAPLYAPCVFTAATGAGHTDSCEERILVGLVRELKEFAKKNGAAQLQLHTTYLPDGETRTCNATVCDPFTPPCSPEADRARSVRLLSEMAFAGDGGFTQFGQASAISFRGLDLHTSREPLVIKEFVVSNINLAPDSSGTHVDTDADGIPDYRESEIRTADGNWALCKSDEDTDGDGISDGVEVKIAYDPLKTNDPIECVDLLYTTESGNDPCSTADPPPTKTWKRYGDKDKDGLNACEERLLGTQDSLFDSDADGIPDYLEFIAGTNYLSVDHLLDSEFDGIVNREEIRGHTDPRANDSQTQLDLAYRYEEVDEGVKEVLSYTQPPTITGVTIKNVSANSTAGIGWLRFQAGPPPTLAWRDSADMGPGGSFGQAVDISTPNKDGYRLTSCATVPGGGCDKTSEDRFLTVLVEGVNSYLPQDATDSIVVSSAQRNCLRFRVRNITLMETGLHRVLGNKGNNLVNVYFSEAPRNAKDGYGIFRKASIQLNYLKGPPEYRTPKAAEMPLSDDDFVLFE